MPGRQAGVSKVIVAAGTVTGSENGVKCERTTTDTGFVYDTGVTIPACV